MGQTTDQIEAHIDHARDRLGSNLHELEEKVKTAADWKHLFKNHPMTMIGAAFGGGILLASLVAGRPDRNSGRVVYQPPAPELHPRSPQRAKAMEAWDNVKGALIGVAATRFKDYVDQVIPGFQEHYRRAEEKTTASHATMGGSSHG